MIDFPNDKSCLNAAQQISHGQAEKNTKDHYFSFLSRAMMWIGVPRNPNVFRIWFSIYLV